jgi:L-lactate dehydrogenase (cytochrome)
MVDSGIRSGVDVAVALALGADAAVLGRAYVYGLMAGGEAGVDRTLSIVTKELHTTMRLLGVTSIPDLRKRGKELLTRES